MSPDKVNCQAELGKNEISVVTKGKRPRETERVEHNAVMKEGSKKIEGEARASEMGGERFAGGLARTYSSLRHCHCPAQAETCRTGNREQYSRCGEDEEDAEDTEEREGIRKKRRRRRRSPAGDRGRGRRLPHTASSYIGRPPPVGSWRRPGLVTAPLGPLNHAISANRSA